MSQKQTAGIADTLDLTGGWVLQFAAVFPTDGSAVAGAKISNVAIVVSQIQGNMTDLQQPAVAPIWIPIPLDQQP